MISGNAVGSCTKNRCPPSKSRSSAPGICDAMAAPLAGGGDAVVPSRGHERRAHHEGEPLVDVVRGACTVLPRLPPVHALGPLHRAALGQHAGQRPIALVLVQPCRGEPGVEDRRGDGGSLGRVHVRQGVERVGRSTGPARRRAEQRQAFDPLGGRDRQLLGDHAPEAEADEAKALPPQMVDQGQGVGRQVGHRVRGRGERRAPQAPLVERRRLELCDQGGDQGSGGGERRAGAVQEQQPRPGSGYLVVELDPVETCGGHGTLCTPTGRP